jgi:DNA-binding beta-propeller fold protein YncE/Mg-chelatase subunit ChlD
MGAVLAMALLSPWPHHARGQAAPGNYVRVATWHETATSIPPRLWIDPAGLAVAPSGLIFTSDSRLRRVEVLNADGTARLTFGRGSSPQDLVAPGHVDVDEARDRVYVADPGIGRLAVYALDGTPVALWPQIAGPTGVAVAPDGRVVVADADGDRVRVFAPDGTEQASWGGTGTGPTQYDYPAGVDVGEDGTVYVADRGNGRVVATTLVGQAVEVYPLDTGQQIAPNQIDLTGADPYDVAVDRDDLYIATDLGLGYYSLETRKMRGVLAQQAVEAVEVTQHGVFGAIVPREGYPEVWRYRYRQATGDPKDRWGSPATVLGFFDGLETLTIGDDERAYLLDVPPRIQRLSLGGVVEGQIDSPDPVEVEADVAGTVYAAAANQLYAYSADGTLRWQSTLRATIPGGGNEEVTGLAWDAARQRLLVLESASHTLFVFDAQGEEVRRWALKPEDDFSQLWTDLAVGPDGTIYALDRGGSQVRGWDPIAFRLLVEVTLSEPAARFDVAPDGTLLVLYTSGWARRLAPDGTVRATWDTTRLDLGRDSRPSDVAVDAAGRVYVVDSQANVVSVFQWDANAPAQTPQQVEQGCDLGGDKRALPGELPLGETVEVNLTARGACAAERSKADIAIMIGSQATGRRVPDAIMQFLDLIDPGSDLVSIEGSRLTADLHFLRRVARQAGFGQAGPSFGRPTGCGGLAGDIATAEQVLFGVRGRPNVRKVIILLVSCSGDAYRQQKAQIKRAAGQAKRRGAEIFAIRFNRGTDEAVLYDIASDPSYVYKSSGEWQLASIYRRISGQIRPTTLLKEITLTDEIPANMAYLVGSAEPPATLHGNTLVWRLTNVGLLGIGVRYLLRPLEPGTWPTNVRAWADYLDATGKAGHIDFPVPMVRVLAPTPTPTVTRTPTPTRTATPRPTATDEPTPTAEPQALYLPLLLRERCDTERRRVDAVLVLDASTSMLEAARSGRSKLEAARSAAQLFLDRLDFSRDQAAIVTFNSDVAVLQALTADRAALDAALAAIAVSPQTRIDLGIEAAAAELVSARHRPGNQRAMIVLTDGRANPVAADVPLARAEEAKAAGVTLYTIGIGEELDVAALERMASRPEYFFRAPDAEDLAQIYAGIAGAIPCPADAFWGGR